MPRFWCRTTLRHVLPARSSFSTRAAMHAAAAARRLLASLAFAAAFVALVAGCGRSPESRASAGDTVRASDTARAAAGSTYADEMARRHAGEEPVASPAARRAPDTAVTGREVVYGTVAGEKLTGYVAVPEYAAADSAAAAGDSAKLPALIAVHEWWGLNDNIRRVARRLAGRGFRVLAVDLYADRVGETPQEARRLMKQVTSDTKAIRRNVEAAYQHLAGEHDASQVGIIGWCFGGGVALNSAIALPGSLDAAVIYYGALENATREALRPVPMPMIGFFGAQDPSIPVERVRRFEQTLGELGKDAEIYIYDDAGHAFANPSGERYVPRAAKDAWQKTIDFLNYYLKE
jgi:carboxymethylenebutenolidase